MKVAAVINVAPGQAGLSQAMRTQTLLLEHLGPQLGSIRLAVPRLLKFACLGALAERPDVFVIAGGPRAARRAGQIAYAHGVPIVFLPGLRTPRWASALWGSLSLEEMVAALAREELRAERLCAGIAGGHMFFDSASCGLLPQIEQLGNDFSEMESLTSAARLLGRIAWASRLSFGQRVRIFCHGAPRRASTIVIYTQGETETPTNARVTRLGSFACAAWRQRAPALTGASVHAISGRDWRNGQEPERFRCTKLTLQAGAKIWLLLDGEPIAFR